MSSLVTGLVWSFAPARRSRAPDNDFSRFDAKTIAEAAARVVAESGDMVDSDPRHDTAGPIRLNARRPRKPPAKKRRDCSGSPDRANDEASVLNRERLNRTASNRVRLDLEEREARRAGMDRCRARLLGNAGRRDRSRESGTTAGGTSRNPNGVRSDICFEHTIWGGGLVFPVLVSVLFVLCHSMSCKNLI